MLRSRLLVLVLGVFLTVSVIAIGCAPKGPAATVAPLFNLKLNTFTFPDSDTTLHLQWYAQEVEKRTNGRVKITVYHSGALGAGNVTLDLVGKGIIDAGLIVPGYTPAALPLTTGTELAYIGTAPDVMMKAGTELYQTYAPLRDEWEKKNNVRVLYHGSTSFAVGWFPKPITKLEDIQGKKLRAYGQFLIIAQKLGATPVNMMVAEVYDAVSKGVVDGILTTPYSDGAAQKWYEVTPYIVDWGANQFSANATAINLDLWKKLPPDIQKILDDLRPEAQNTCLEKIAEVTARYNKIMKDTGKVQWYVLPPAEANRWKALVVPALWDEWAATQEKAGLPGKEFLDKFRAAVEKYKPQSKWTHPFPK